MTMLNLIDYTRTHTLLNNPSPWRTGSYTV